MRSLCSFCDGPVTFRGFQGRKRRTYCSKCNIEHPVRSEDFAVTFYHRSPSDDFEYYERRLAESGWVGFGTESFYLYPRAQSFSVDLAWIPDAMKIMFGVIKRLMHGYAPPEKTLADYSDEQFRELARKQRDVVWWVIT